MFDRFFNAGRALAKKATAKRKADAAATREQIRATARRIRKELGLAPDPRLG
jgi:hypothetical protein